MPTLSFRDYIKNRKASDTPAGDFVRDAKEDRKLPNATSWSQLESYLVTRGAIYDARKAARTVWSGYLARPIRQGSANFEA